MRSGNGKHRRPRQAPAIVVAAGVTGSALAIPLLGATSAGAAEAGTWDRVAECESGGMWSADLGNGYYGGLQFSQEKWDRYGGRAYAPRADLASRAQQIEVAEKAFKAEGPQAWPSCAVISGLAPGGGSGSGSASGRGGVDAADPGSDAGLDAGVDSRTPPQPGSGSVKPDDPDVRPTHETPGTDSATDPSTAPTEDPSTAPTTDPSTGPDATPSAGQSSGPGAGPSTTPSTGPSATPSTGPSTTPSTGPSATPDAGAGTPSNGPWAFPGGPYAAPWAIAAPSGPAVAPWAPVEPAPGSSVSPSTGPTGERPAPGATDSGTHATPDATATPGTGTPDTPDASASSGPATSGGGKHRGTPAPENSLPAPGDSPASGSEREAGDAADEGDREGGRHASRDGGGKGEDKGASEGRGTVEAPESGTYTVRPGDSLWHIADETKVPGGWSALYEANRDSLGTDPDLIKPGQHLELKDGQVAEKAEKAEK
ncbi:transglycosylase family protein [Streptomyces sp. NBC_00237]|uniref:transglycosylase family protein n=1 Tax=Streptomyces sp. NBC_00237 TaxID=2975687 RepID=UPI002252ABEF|nr:transglycosylase family protein [Streptomyces sp. NBC_00237]MCX5200762.1 transglycosylase family protein [Streptomyces sp. NBC_00237]